MALDTKHRSSIYNKLLDTLGEEDASVLMDQFPAIEADELVTKQFLRAEMADFRTEFADLRTEFADLRTEFADLRTELKTDIADLRTEFHTEMHALSTRLMTWTIATMFTGIGLAVAATRALG